MTEQPGDDVTTWVRVTRRAPTVMALGAAAMTASLVLGRPMLVLLVVPLLAAALIGVARTAAPSFGSAAIRVAPVRVFEGDTVTVSVDLAGLGRDVHATLALDHGPAFVAESPTPVLFRVDPTTDVAGAGATASVRLVAQRWGGHRLGPARLRLADRDGWLQTEALVRSVGSVRVLPRPETLRRLLRSRHTQVFSGNQPASASGAGIEFVGMRPFTAGDRVREVNWRVTARRPGVWVTERHPERNTDIVMFVDTFDEPVLTDVVRLASSLVTALLHDHDRVGLVAFGGVMHWIRPGMGLRQQYVIVDALVSAKVFESFAWKDVSSIPPRVLPPEALVMAVSPLIDERAINALIDLRRRGIRLAVIEVAPPEVELLDETDAGRFARRLWEQHRETVRTKLRLMGVSLAQWERGRSLELVLEDLRQCNRHQYTAR